MTKLIILYKEGKNHLKKNLNNVKILLFNKYEINYPKVDLPVPYIPNKFILKVSLLFILSQIGIT